MCIYCACVPYPLNHWLIFFNYWKKDYIYYCYYYYFFRRGGLHVSNTNEYVCKHSFSIIRKYGIKLNYPIFSFNFRSGWHSYHIFLCFHGPWTVHGQWRTLGTAVELHDLYSKGLFVCDLDQQLFEKKDFKYILPNIELHKSKYWLIAVWIPKNLLYIPYMLKIWLSITTCSNSLIKWKASDWTVSNFAKKSIWILTKSIYVHIYVFLWSNKWSNEYFSKLIYVKCILQYIM